MNTKTVINTANELKEEKSIITVKILIDNVIIDVLSPDGRLEWELSRVEWDNLVHKGNSLLQDKGL